jgi:hypothetical protein
MTTLPERIQRSSPALYERNNQLPLNGKRVTEKNSQCNEETHEEERPGGLDMYREFAAVDGF